MAVKKQSQIGLEDRVVSNTTILEMLEMRERMKKSLSDLRNRYNESSR